jgi:hypothetical protein
MRIPSRPPDAARLAQAQAELARVEARLKRDALKADVIARIVSDTAKNKDVLDRPAVFAALTQDPDSLAELARQAGWLAEETPATGTEMRRAGTLLGSLLNAFQVPSKQTEVAPIRQAQSNNSIRIVREEQSREDPSISLGPTVNVSQSPSIVPMMELSKAVVTQVGLQQKATATDGSRGNGFHVPLIFPTRQLRTASPVLFIAFALFAVGLLACFYF